MPPLLVVAWLVGALIVAVLANARGRSPVGWFLLGIATTPIVAVIVLLLTPDVVREDERHEELLDALRRR